MDASSHAGFKKWAKGLDQFEALCLEIFRSGAVKSKTRSREAAVCHLCGEPLPSFRHLWQECSAFDQKRAELARAHKLPGTFWRRQPRVTSKSGWITYAAGRTAERRATMQLAACQLGVHIVKTLSCTTGRASTRLFPSVNSRVRVLAVQLFLSRTSTPCGGRLRRVRAAPQALRRDAGKAPRESVYSRFCVPR